MPMAAANTPTPGDSVNETEERLLDCALTLFAAQGYEGASVREIIEAAGVTRPVLYYYCDNKEHLFKRVVQWTHDDAYRDLEQALSAEASVASQLRVLMRGTFAFCANDPRIPQLMFQAAYGSGASELAEFMRAQANRRFALVVDIMQRGMVAGELQSGDAAALALVFCSLMDYHANALSRLPTPERLLTDERADALVNTFLHGLGMGRRKAPELPPL